MGFPMAPIDASCAVFGREAAKSQKRAPLTSDARPSQCRFSDDLAGFASLAGPCTPTGLAENPLKH